VFINLFIGIEPFGPYGPLVPDLAVN